MSIEGKETILVSACLLGQRVRYDSSFTGSLRVGDGLTTQYLQEKGGACLS